MEISIKITDKMLKEAFDKAMKDVETITGISLMECVEKQIPQNIEVRVVKEEENRKYHYCPMCKRWLTSMTSYCPDCGQALDWGEA